MASKRCSVLVTHEVSGSVRQGNQSCDTTKQMPLLEIDARPRTLLFSVESSVSFSLLTKEVVRDIWM